MNTEAIVSTLHPNVQDDGGNALTILHAPANRQPTSSQNSAPVAARQRQEPAGKPDIEASRSLSGRENAAPGAAYVSMYQVAGAPAQPTPITLGGTIRPVTPSAEPIRREHIMEEFQRAFGVKVYQGKPFKGRRMLGFHRPKTGEVRIKKHNDLEVTAHEVFHWLDRKHPTIRKLYHEPRFGGELRSISYDASKLNEGFAEFGRLFMTNETEAVAKAPQFYGAFVAETRRLGIYQKLSRVQLRMHEWYQQGAEARALSKIGSQRPGLGIGRSKPGFEFPIRVTRGITCLTSFCSSRVLRSPSIRSPASTFALRPEKAVDQLCRWHRPYR